MILIASKEVPPLWLPNCLYEFLQPRAVVGFDLQAGDDDAIVWLDELNILWRPPHVVDRRLDFAEGQRLSRVVWTDKNRHVSRLQSYRRGGRHRPKSQGNRFDHLTQYPTCAFVMMVRAKG